MGVTGPKERATFSISARIKAELDRSVPRSKRSQFVERAISAALRVEARDEFRAFLDRLPTGKPASESSTDFLRRKRAEWDGRRPEILAGRPK